MKGSKIITNTYKRFRLLTASFFLVVFATLQLSLSFHHHSTSDATQQHSNLKQKCELCLFIAAKQGDVVLPLADVVPSAKVIELSTFNSFTAHYELFGFGTNYLNKGPPYLLLQG
jgi:hypothetical protein